MLTKGAIGNLVNKYRAVLKKCGLLNIFGSLALAGALTVGAAGMAGAVPYDQMGNFTAGTSYDSTSGGASDTVVVTKADGAITGTGTVTIDAAKGLEINAVSGAGKLSVGDSQDMTVNNGLKLAAGSVITTNDATLEINGTDAAVNMMVPAGEMIGSATITGSVAEGDAGLATINVTKGTLGAYTTDGKFAIMALTGPVAVNVAATDGKLVANEVYLERGATLTNHNDVTLNGTAGNVDGLSMAFMHIDNSTYAGNLTVNATTPDTAPLSIGSGKLDGTLDVVNGSVELDKAIITGAVDVSGGSLYVLQGVDKNDNTSTLDSLTINGGTGKVYGTLDVTNALTLGTARGTTFTLAKGTVLAAGSLASAPYTSAADATNGYSAYVTLDGDATVANASTLSNGIFNVGGTLTMGGDLTLKNDTVESKEVRGAVMTVRDGGTLDMGSGGAAKSINIIGQSSLEVQDGGTLKLAQGQTITVGGTDFGSGRTEADGNFVLYGTDAFGTGKIEGGVTLTDGTLKFNRDADITDLMSVNAADGKISFEHDSSGSGKAGVLSVNKTLTYTGNSLELGDAAGTLQGGQLVLGETDFTMTKGTLTSLGGLTKFEDYTPIGYTPGITVGNGTGTLTLTADSTLNLSNVATRTSEVKAGKIDVGAGKMNVIVGKWQVADLTVGGNGTLTVEAPGVTGIATGLTVTGLFDTATGSTGVADIVNGTLTLDGTVNTANDSLKIGGLGQVVTDLSTAYTGNALASGFGTVTGTGLLTLRNDTGTTEMSLTDYKTMTEALQGSSGKNVGVSVDNLTISGTEGATLDGAPGAGKVNVAGVTGLENVVASVSDSTVQLDSRTDLKGLNVAEAGTSITVGNTQSTVMTLKGDASNHDFDLDAGGKADITVSNGSILNLGSMAGDKTYGNLSGGVTLSAAGDTLNVVNGYFIIESGGVTGTSSSEGTIVVSNGTLTTFAPVTNVNLQASDKGLLWIAAVDSSMKNLSLNNSGLLGSNMTVTGDVVMSNGNIIDEMSLNLEKGASNASGSIEATGNITTNNAGITARGNLTLSAGRNIDTGTGDIAATKVTAGEDISAGNVTADTVTAGTTITAADVTATNVQAKSLTASGDVTVTDGVLNTTGTGADASSVGSLALNNASGVVGDLSVSGTATVDSSSLQTGKLDITGQTMHVLNSTASIKELTATGGTFFVDPAYVNIDGLAADTVDFALLVSDGSVVNIGGMSGADLSTALAQAGMSVGPDLTLATGQSGLALASPVTVSGAGKIVVDAGVDASGQINGAAVNHQAYFGADSVLVVDASKLGADAAITSGTATGPVTKTAVIDPAAHLQVVNATKGEVTLLDGFTGGITSDGTTGTDYGWVKNSVANPDRMLTSTAAVDAAVGSVTLTNTVNKASDVLPGLDGELNPAMADVWDNAKNDVNAEARGVRFLSRAARADYIADARQAAVTIESAARMALAGAVPQMTMAASNAAGNAVTQRTGLAQPGGNAIQSMGTDGSMQTGASAGDAAKTGFAMWIMPLYQSSNGFGMKAGNFDMDFSGGLGGVAIGADYTFDNAIRAGITFNIGGGYAQGSGDLNETTNNMNFWGIGAYAGWTPGNFGLTADVNYTSTYNKLEQDLPASMQMGKLKSDVTAYAISAGLRGEYKIETSALDIIPHVGVRYMSLNTDEYDVKSGGTLLKGDAINQSIWTFPIGVAFSKQIETGNGWHFKPSLDLAVIPAAGDIDARSDVRFTGTGTKAELDTQTMDYVSYMGQAGLEFGNDTTTLGVNYNIQLGAKSTAHGVFGTFRYEF